MTQATLRKAPTKAPVSERRPSTHLITKSESKNFTHDASSTDFSTHHNVCPTEIGFIFGCKTLQLLGWRMLTSQAHPSAGCRRDVNLVCDLQLEKEGNPKVPAMWSFLSNYCKDTKKEKTSKISQITYTLFDMQNYNSFEFQPVMTTRSSSNKALGRNFNAKGSFTSSGDSSEFRHRLRNPTCASEKPRDMINPWGKVTKVNISEAPPTFCLKQKWKAMQAFNSIGLWQNASKCQSKWSEVQGTDSAHSELWFCAANAANPSSHDLAPVKNFVTHQTKTPIFFRQNYRMLSFPSPSGFFSHLWDPRCRQSLQSLQSLPSFAFSFIRFKVPVIFAIWAPSNGKHVKITTLEMGKFKATPVFFQLKWH